MTEKSPEFLIDNATYFKSDELLRYLHILDTLAYESLAAQLKYFEKEINNNNSPSTIKQLKWIATKKYMCFFEVKKSLLKSSDFIDINKIAISNKNDLYNIIRRPNITQFFNLLFANFDPTVPDLQNVDIKSFFSYVVPSSLMQSEAIWDLYLNLRVQIYISKINKNPQRNLFKTMFPNVDGEDGPPMYKETYKKFCNKIQCFPDDVEMLMKEFKWSKFVQDMFKCLSNIFNRVNESEMPLLYKYPSIEALPISSSSSSSNSSARVVIIEDIPREDVDNSAKKRRLADTEENDDDISSDNIDDNIGDNLVDSSSISNKEEIEQITSQNNSQSVELIVHTELKRTQSDLLPNSDGESLSSTLNPRTPRSERRSERDNKANSNGRRATLSTRKTMERSSSSLTNMIVDQPESVDDRQSSSDESFTEGSPPYEQNEGSSRNKLGKRKAIDNADYADNDENKRMTKRIKVMWTDRELLALEEGMRQHGKQWTTIKKNYGEKGQILENRSAAKLKDKARCEYHRRQRDGIEAGVFGIMDGQ